MTRKPKKPAPPSASGPAGADFEVKIGATYLLAMLRGAEARGLPGATIDRVEFQRAPDGYPLDDIIVHGREADGTTATLEVQVKREISFAPKDEVFKEVVGQIAEAMKKPAFQTERYELAIATAKATRAITGSYQEVLTWARKLTSVTAFMRRLTKQKVANEDMRGFVTTLREHLKAFGMQHDDEAVWEVLRRLQIHYYDFLAPESESEAYSRDRAANVLHLGNKAEAGNFWEELIAHTLSLSASGGEATQLSLTEKFKGRFRFEVNPHYHAVRAAVAEASALALEDISTRVLGVSLSRGKRVDEIRAAVEIGQRLIEIRGDAGVGKSALLKHVAGEISLQCRVVVLAPGRVTPRGWTAMRSQLGFDGSIDTFLRDLATDGGGWLFVDNLDFYNSDERLTVNDLVRAAAAIPGFTVIATARRSFGVNEPSWLSTDAIDLLGRANPVEIAPIDDDELEELRETEPRLRALLAPDHPANAVTRNLYFLSRLLKLPGEEPTPRSEIEIALAWWRTAAGEPKDHTARERGRALRELGAQSVRGGQFFDVAARDASAIDALIQSETLTDFGNDRVGFRHDVLREWAIANALITFPALIAELPLSSLGTPAQTRGLELAARITLEDKRDSGAWRAILDTVSVSGSHPSWRRALMLAMVHSELIEQTIALMAEVLLANDGALLRELIPIVLAVDVQSARDTYAGSGIDVSAIPEGINLPSRPSWVHLIMWLLSLGPSLPLAAIPEVIDLYIGWCALGMFVPQLPLTREVLIQFKIWLVEIERAGHDAWQRDHRDAFGGALKTTEIKRAEEGLRLWLSMMAVRVPDIAQQYLIHVQSLERKDEVYEVLLKFPGSFARAAPKELAAITLDYLRKKDHDEDIDDEFRPDGALRYVDKDFVPESPAQGPFFELLTHSPKIGLQLIRTLVDDVVGYQTRGNSPADDDVLLIEFSDGIRRFPWIKTYAWSEQSFHPSITSALMALEAWAHQRIENGDSVDTVITDIVGEDDAPTAYILVVVHVLLSHWPKTSRIAVPFVGCPELLSLDLARPTSATFHEIDLFGLRNLSKEPTTGPKLEVLRSRISRRVSLDHLLSLYATHSDLEVERSTVETLLRRASMRLGQHQPGDDKSNPRLMAFHALNLLDRKNWVEQKGLDENGQPITGFGYVSPPAEAQHFEPMQAKVEANSSELAHTLKIGSLVDNPEKSSPEMASVLSSWAQSISTAGEVSEEIHQAIVGAAMIVMRDGSPEHRAQYAQWAETQFAYALGGDPDIGGRMRSGMLYNLVAMAYAGRIFAMRGTTPTRANYERILQMTAADAAAARGAAPAASAIDEVDTRLRRSILRVAFTAAVHFWHSYRVDDDAKRKANETHKQDVARAIEAELDWLVDDKSEPIWPVFSLDEIRTGNRRRGIRIGGAGEANLGKPKHDEGSRRFTDHQTAALWLSALLNKADADRAWMNDIETTYAAWTYAANGAGLDDMEEITNTPHEWNSAFFSVVAANLRAKPLATVKGVFEPLFKLHDQQFFDLTADVLHKIDIVFFNDQAISPDVAINIRTWFAERLAMSYGWQRLRGDMSGMVERHIGSAAATLFFSMHGFAQAPRCYLPSALLAPSLMFAPLLQRLAESCPSLFVGMVVMNWVEVKPTTEHLPLVLDFAIAVLGVHPNDRPFWIEHLMGQRICNWLSSLCDVDPDAFAAGAPHRAAIDRLLASLVAEGVVEARRLETKLQGRGSKREGNF